MTISKDRNICISGWRVPIAEVYNPLSRNFNDTHLDQIEESSTKMTLAYGVVKVKGLAALPAPENVEDWLCPE